MPRARAAPFTGSGFGPASGGHTTAAIVSPAASRPRSTSSAKAACPTRRMRIAGSGFQMRREELLEPPPRVLGGGLLVRGALVAEEAVLRAGVDDDRSEEHTSELQSRSDLVCRLLLEKKNNQS